MRQIGIMGGTFNPTHTRYLMVAQCGLFQHHLEKVLFIPTGLPPHKKTDLLDKELRFEMLAAAVADNPAFEASRIEIDRPGISWSIDTLKELAQLYGAGVQLNFIIGEDNIKALQLYEKRAEFLSLCRLLVSPRDLSGNVDLWRQTLPEAQIEKIDCPMSSVSSTLVRNWIRSGQPIRYLVPPAVEHLIVTKGHYKVVPSPDPAATTTVSLPPAPATTPVDPQAGTK